MPRGVQALPLVVRKRRVPGTHAVTGLAVIVGPARRQEREILRHEAIAFDRGGIMIRMVDLDRIEACSRERRNARVDLRAARMRERRETSGPMNRVDDVLRGGAGSRNERGAIASQPSIEGLLGIGDVAGGDHGARDLRASDRAVRALVSRCEQRLKIRWHTERGEAFGDGEHPGHARCTLRGEKRAECLISRIEKVPKDVDIATVFDRCHFNARDRLDAALAGEPAHLVHGCDGVVIGSGDDREPDAYGFIDQLGWTRAPVGGGGVEVEIGQGCRVRLGRTSACVGARGGRSRRRARSSARATLALDERLVFAKQQIEVIALFVGKLEENLLAF